jgi:hypothetical protein
MTLRLNASKKSVMPPLELVGGFFRLKGVVVVVVAVSLWHYWESLGSAVDRHSADYPGFTCGRFSVAVIESSPPYRSC